MVMNFHGSRSREKNNMLPVICKESLTGTEERIFSSIRGSHVLFFHKKALFTIRLFLYTKQG
jgi:hypothetical protein